jgi:hypothetical protein
MVSTAKFTAQTTDQKHAHEQKGCGSVASNQFTKPSKPLTKGKTNMGLTIHYSLKARGSETRARNNRVPISSLYFREVVRSPIQRKSWLFGEES